MAQFLGEYGPGRQASPSGIGDAPSPAVYGPPPPKKARRKLILCFDGTGNKFQGTQADSNILKFYRMLDRQADQVCYYQPGIGTYVHSNSWGSHTGMYARIRSWYKKALDSAVGSSFAEHVMAAYLWCVHTARADDDIAMIGFSRGAYTARFLAEMLDYVGLLDAGNEELARFAWKTFSQWQIRTDKNDPKTKEIFRFMEAFRETFGKPMRRICFLGLFDGVNSVSSFEAAFLERSKFPYTARSSAKVIRHAVSIDERRAKFRQDLVSGPAPKAPQRKSHHNMAADATRKFSLWVKPEHQAQSDATDPSGDKETKSGPGQYRNQNRKPKETRTGREKERTDIDMLSARYRPTSRRSRSYNRSSHDSARDFVSANASQASLDVIQQRIYMDGGDSDSEDETEQSIEEVWFPGCHADIGGGWTLAPGEEMPLSHVSLVWMVREAQKAGLIFDEEKMRKLNCLNDKNNLFNSYTFGKRSDSTPAPPVPQVMISGDPVPDTPSFEENNQQPLEPSKFEKALESAATKGVMHDCLAFNNGLSHLSVLSWWLLEVLPFRRMDLRPEGHWEPIRWPLPKGEVRDFPDDAHIHISVLQRMQANPNYRPGNIIVGGGGRGIRIAPAEYGTGEWVVVREEGDCVGHVVKRKHKPGYKPSVAEKSSETS